MKVNDTIIALVKYKHSWISSFTFVKIEAIIIKEFQNGNFLVINNKGFRSFKVIKTFSAESKNCIPIEFELTKEAIEYLNNKKKEDDFRNLPEEERIKIAQEKYNQLKERLNRKLKEPQKM